MTAPSQSTFRAALIDPTAPVPEGVLDSRGRAASKRFDIYRNNVIVSLKEAMQASFPAIAALIGPQNFATVSDLFVRQHPPSDPRMMLYGDKFPAFLTEFKPLSHLGYLADLARLEQARRVSYHAGDATPIDPALFGETPPERLASARIRLAPAVQIISAPWPILDIWNFALTPGAPQPLGHAQEVIVLRPDYDPVLHLAPSGGATLLKLLGAGQALGTALAMVHDAVPDFDFPALLGTLLSGGAICDLSYP